MTHSNDNENFPTVTQLWKRFGHGKSKMHTSVFDMDDTTSPAKHGPQTVVAAAGDLVDDIILTPCTADCQHHLDEDFPENTEFLAIRPDGRVEIIRRGKGGGADTTTVEVFSVKTGTELTPEMLASLPDPTQLCEECEMFNFGFLSDGILSSNEDTDEIGIAALAWAALELPKDRRQDFHKTFEELQDSAQRCAACAVVLAALPDPEGFVADDERPIILRPDAKSSDGMDSRSVRNVEAGFPELDPFHPGAEVTRFGIIDVICDYDAPAATWPMGIRGRPVPVASDTTLALRWMRECSDNHETCRFTASARIMPTRVIRVPHDEGSDPWLEDGKGMTDDYVALSYRWGSANMSKTLTSNLSQHQTAIPLSGLSKTIREAIDVTRQLGYKYLWVDSLCIIQDSNDDWSREASRMADVYENAALTISASASSSADSGLFFQQPPTYIVPVIARTIGGKRFSNFSLALRNCSSFASDVQNGQLSSRGWCLQERLLSRRILHFGASQTHWECLSAAWSADYSRLNDSDASSLSIRKAFQTDLRRSIPKPGPKLLSIVPPELDTSQGLMIWKGTDEEFAAMKSSEPLEIRQLYGLEPHGTWYRMLLDYSRRELTFPSDKLAALAGLASSFGQKTGDVYLNGLWLHGLPEGLLWSSLGLCRRTYERASLSKCPPTKRAPSWSWASQDGPVVYSSSKYSYVDASVHAYSIPGNPPGKSPALNSNNPTDDLNEDIIGTNPSQRLILKACVKPLTSLQGFKPDQRKHLRENKDSRNAQFVPHAIFDDPNRSYDDIDGVYALFIAQVGCGNRDCDHRNNCETGFAHCLLVLRREVDMQGGNRKEVVWERVGVAQCFSGDVGRGMKIFVTLV